MLGSYVGGEVHECMVKFSSVSKRSVSMSPIVDKTWVIVKVVKDIFHWTKSYVMLTSILTDRWGSVVNSSLLPAAYAAAGLHLAFQSVRP